MLYSFVKHWLDFQFLSSQDNRVTLLSINNLCRPSALLSTVFFSEVPYHVKSHCKLKANLKLLHLSCI